jgi:16S rRNA (cytosine967-C5)-methyltransferase
VSEGAAPGQAARAAARAILSDVLRGKRGLDAVIEDDLNALNLPARDAGFARAIVGETLRHLGQLSDLIREFVPKAPPSHKAGPTLEILLLGACELLFLNVPAHAAVDGANRLAAADSKAVHFKGLINAVLRRVTREGAGLIAGQDADNLNTPDWLWDRWLAVYGEETTRAIAEAHRQTPPLDLTLKDPRDAAEDFPDALRVLPATLRLTKAGRVNALPGFALGRWWVQDAAASLPVLLFGEIAGKRAIDLCAAPGGKTAQLASRGAQVTAVELAPDRMALVAENLARLKLDGELAVSDARDFRPPEPADCVLLDAPCTATGTIRRHPDLPWNKNAGDLGALSFLQGELLDAAAEMTAIGGTLVYAVCSLEPEEGVDQVEAFLARRADFARAPIAPDAVFAAAWITPQGDLRTLPCHWSDRGGMDGFYATRLVRS